MDPEGSPTDWCGGEAGRGLDDVDAGERGLDDVARPTPWSGAELVAASAHLASADRLLAGEVGVELALRRALEAAAPRDYVVVDCPPALGLLGVSALAGCAEALVPVAAHVMDLAGLASLTQTVARVQERLHPGLRVTGVLACRVDTRTALAREVVARPRERLGEAVLAAVVRENVRLAEAPSFRRPITAYAPASAGAADYRAVAAEVAARATGVAA